MSVKEYFVGVETIDDENPTATEIKFNNVIIWKRGNPPLSTLPIGNSQATTNDIVLTEIYEDKKDDKNVTYEDNPSLPPMNGSSILKEDSLNQENPMNSDVKKKGNSRPISEAEPVVVSSKNEFNNIGDHYGQTLSVDKKKTANSLSRERGKFVSDTRRRTTFGGRKSSIKNKKKTKTMRRKRRNL
jgi:hypothetical protein